ncbi:atypical kinase COQ8B, mitochondrial [Anopheles arabiensis]|uniref:ABC1 atypical kinase-like domain-containing protein n=1 Tax=Anopheles arabiensis TaxID=7173 RepID=A0A182HTW3_ANOAR|nr:atypical kinase COQ8B, mitochondrial [Anopheles arabiensis]
MSRAQDAVGILRGLKIVADAVGKSQSEYAKHLWANSSVREVLEQQLATGEQSVKQVLNNPTQELEKVGGKLRETIERTAVVAEGLRQLTAAAIPKVGPLSPDAFLNQRIPSAGTVAPPGSEPSGDIASLDISKITLKELESILSEHSKTREIKLGLDNGKRSTTKHVEPIVAKESLAVAAESHTAAPSQTILPPEPAARLKEPARETKAFTRDEQQIEKMLHFVSSYDKNPSATVPPPAVPPVNPAQPIELPQLSTVAKQRKVPSSRVARLASFGGLFAGLGLGTVNELAKGALGIGGTLDVKQALFSPTNAERIVDTLCKVRGAALKLGQILSIQDSNIVSPQLVKAFERVRQAADYMPDWQVERQLVSELGPDWRSKLQSFDQKPFAAASIGQVHRGVLKDGGMEVAIKIQYPGVAKSIESDIDNLVSMLKVWDVFPAGVFIDNVVAVAKRELAWEVDYTREAEYTERFAEMIRHMPEYRVPRVVKELTSKNVLTTELVPGVPMDRCFDMSQEHRDHIAYCVMKLCLNELFTFRCMQTDPNWSNFLYDASTKQVMLIDFGATRFYQKAFMDDYLRVIIAATKNDRQQILELSRKMGFLTGYETPAMEKAHVDAVLILGEVFSVPGEFEFGRQSTTKKIAALVPVMIAHRLCPPPEEIYSLHRKLSGVFLLCARLNAKIDCKPIFNEVMQNYKFD